MSESTIGKSIQVAASTVGSRLWRNNVALAWVGESVRMPNGDLLIKSPRPLHAGLCEGSSDYIGITPITITAGMVGKTIGVFTAIEAKTKTGRLSELQRNFIGTIQTLGGIAGVARSAEDAMKIMISAQGKPV
jgi:hypothetical protein